MNLKVYSVFSIPESAVIFSKHSMLASFDARFKYLVFPPSYESLTTTQPQVALGGDLVSMCSCVCACVSILIERRRERERRKRDRWMDR